MLTKRCWLCITLSPKSCQKKWNLPPRNHFWIGTRFGHSPEGPLVAGPTDTLSYATWEEVEEPTSWEPVEVDGDWIGRWWKLGTKVKVYLVRAQVLLDFSPCQSQIAYLALITLVCRLSYSSFDCPIIRRFEWTSNYSRLTHQQKPLK